jgi:Sec-independent protein translocase protein TatA
MNREDDTRDSTKASGGRLSMMKFVVGKWKVSAIIAMVGISTRILYNYIRAMGKIIASLRKHRQEKSKADDNAQLNELLDQRECENAVSQTKTDVKREALESVAQDELIQVILELDSGEQLEGIFCHVADEGIRDIGVDLTVVERFGNVTFSCNRFQMLKLAIKLAQISPPLRLGNLDKTGCISEFREQLEMAQVLQQLKPTVRH